MVSNIPIGILKFTRDNSAGEYNDGERHTSQGVNQK